MKQNNVETLDIYYKHIEQLRCKEGAKCASYVTMAANGAITVRFFGDANLEDINNMLCYAVYTAHDEGLNVQAKSATLMEDKHPDDK